MELVDEDVDLREGSNLMVRVDVVEEEVSDFPNFTTSFLGVGFKYIIPVKGALT